MPEPVLEKADTIAVEGLVALPQHWVATDAEYSKVLIATGGNMDLQKVSGLLDGSGL